MHVYDHFGRTKFDPMDKLNVSEGKLIPKKNSSIVLSWMGFGKVHFRWEG
jgi:hypothetical protein